MNALEEGFQEAQALPVPSARVFPPRVLLVLSWRGQLQQRSDDLQRFIGDAGNTEAGRPSHRHGLELTNYYSPASWLTFDLDVSLSRARFTDADPSGDIIPGAVSTVVQAGVTVDSVKNVFGSVRWRYFGPRALIEDGSVRSKATSLVNLEAGYRFTRSLRLAVDVFNLLDSRHSDVDYFYASRLPGEPAEGIEDLHLHPTLPRTARLSLSVGF